MTGGTKASAITAKAVLYSGFGGFEVVSIGDRPVRPPEPGEVRVKVAAAAVSPVDILVRDPGLGVLPLPMTPGMDLAGTVEAVGDAVTTVAVGDEIMGVLTAMRPEGGAQASFVTMPAASVVTLPKGVSPTEAATLPMNSLTALSALESAALAPGQTFAVTGGAGWLAYLAIVFAKSQGLRVVADAKPADFDLVRGYGADIVVERGDDFAQAIRNSVAEGVDVLFDTAVLGEKTFAAIKDGGAYIPVRGPIDAALVRGIRMKPVEVNEARTRTALLEKVRAFVETGAIKPKVAATFPLDQIEDAQRFIMAGSVRGRPVITF